jgi:hypothetical protein
LTDNLALGKTFNTWKESKALLEKAGFVDVVEKRFKWPMNGWPNDPALKQLGELNQLRLTEHVQGFTLRLLTGAGEVSASTTSLITLKLTDCSVATTT